MSLIIVICLNLDLANYHFSKRNLELFKESNLKIALKTPTSWRIHSPESRERICSGGLEDKIIRVNNQSTS